MSVIKEYISLQQREIDLSVYERAENLMDDLIRLGAFDIYILDIIMTGMGGIQLGLEIRQTDTAGKILYLTSSRDYAIDSYKAKASGYLLKPVQKDELFAALDDVIQTIANRKEKRFIVKTGAGSIKLSFDSILYAELNNKVITYHLLNGGPVESVMIRTAFSSAVEELLRDERFVLCGSSIVVNLYYITMAESNTLLFKNGSKLYIGRRAGREICSVWTDFWISGEGSK